MASQITGNSIVCSTAMVSLKAKMIWKFRIIGSFWGEPPHKWATMRKAFHVKTSSYHNNIFHYMIII